MMTDEGVSVGQTLSPTVSFMDLAPTLGVVASEVGLLEQIPHRIRMAIETRIGFDVGMDELEYRYMTMRTET